MRGMLVRGSRFAKGVSAEVEARENAMRIAAKLSAARAGVVVASADSTNMLARSVALATGAKIRLFAFESGTQAMAGYRFRAGAGRKAALDFGRNMSLDDQAAEMKTLFAAAKSEGGELDVFATHDTLAKCADSLKGISFDYAAIYDTHRIAADGLAAHPLFNGSIDIGNRLSFTGEPRHKNIDFFEDDQSLSNAGGILYPEDGGANAARFAVTPAEKMFGFTGGTADMTRICGIPCFKVEDSQHLKEASVYLICGNDGRVYIGSTREFSQRRRSHRNRSVNKKMEVDEAAAYYLVETLLFANGCGVIEKGDALCCRENYWIAEALKNTNPEAFAKGELDFSRIKNFHYATPHKHGNGGGDWAGFIGNVFDQYDKVTQIYKKYGWKLDESGFPPGHINMPKRVNPTHYNMLQSIEAGKFEVGDDSVREFLYTLSPEKRRQRFGGKIRDSVSAREVELAKDILIGECRMEKLTSAEKLSAGMMRKTSIDNWCALYERVRALHGELCAKHGCPVETGRFVPGSVRIPYKPDLEHYKLVHAIEQGRGKNVLDPVLEFFDRCGIRPLDKEQTKKALSMRLVQSSDVEITDALDSLCRGGEKSAVAQRGSVLAIT